MNTRTKESTVEQIEKQMAENTAKLKQEAEAIEKDEHLSNEGRLAKLAAIDKAAEERHRDELTPALQQAVKKEYDTRYGMAFKRPFGASIDSSRAVYSMANAAADAKALERLKAQAINTGDKLLLEAVWHNAYDRGFDHLLNDGDEYIQDFLDFAYTHGRQTNDPQRKRRVLQKRLEQSIRTTKPYR